jgi:hypothetical protein
MRIFLRATSLRRWTCLQERVCGAGGNGNTVRGKRGELSSSGAEDRPGSVLWGRQRCFDRTGPGALGYGADDQKLLNNDSMHTLWTNGTLPNGQRMHYAMGFVVDAIGEHREIWHNGYSPKAGGYCLNAIFPEDDLAVIVLSNSPDFSVPRPAGKDREERAGAI